MIVMYPRNRDRSPSPNQVAIATCARRYGSVDPRLSSRASTCSLSRGAAGTIFIVCSILRSCVQKIQPLVSLIILERERQLDGKVQQPHAALGRTVCCHAHQRPITRSALRADSVCISCSPNSPRNVNCNSDVSILGELAWALPMSNP